MSIKGHLLYYCECHECMGINNGYNHCNEGVCVCTCTCIYMCVCVCVCGFGCVCVCVGACMCVLLLLCLSLVKAFAGFSECHATVV